MKFDPPLVEARLVRRYKRFFADVVLADGTEATAHCPNPGSMLSLIEEGGACLISRSDNPRRKLALTLEYLRNNDQWTGVNTHRANALAAEALAANALPGLKSSGEVRAEVAYGERSRVDFLLEADEAGRRTFIEVKSVTLSRKDGLAEFPDSRSERAVKHLGELEGVAAMGDRAVVLLLVQRADCTRFAPAADIDPAFAAAFERAQQQGVEVIAHRVIADRNGACIDPLPLALQS